MVSWRTYRRTCINDAVLRLHLLLTSEETFHTTYGRHPEWRREWVSTWRAQSYQFLCRMHCLTSARIRGGDWDANLVMKWIRWLADGQVIILYLAEKSSISSLICEWGLAWRGWNTNQEPPTYDALRACTSFDCSTTSSGRQNSTEICSWNAEA